MKLQQWTIYAESEEWIGPISLAVNGASTDTYEVTVGKRSQRPLGPWVATTAADYVDDAGATVPGHGVKVGPGSPFALPIGSWFILARATTSLERPIVEVGIVNII
jgi:hypothetical protein